jgi:hypothetical protein
MSIITVELDEETIIEVPHETFEMSSIYSTFDEEPLSCYEDYFNSKKTRNIVNTHISDYNCGGYCLNTFSWYNPYEDPGLDEGYESFSEWVEDLGRGWEMPIEEIYEYMLNLGKDKILEDFPDTVRQVYSFEQVAADEKLVAYRIGFVFEEDDGGKLYVEHADFHFKQWEGSFWTDKPGSSNLRFEHDTIDEMLDKVWVNSWWDGSGYDSDVILFAVKKG